MFYPLNYGQESLSTDGAPADELTVPVVDGGVVAHRLWGQWLMDNLRLRLVDDLRLRVMDDRWSSVLTDDCTQDEAK